MSLLRVVVFPPCFNQDLCVKQAIEDFAVGEFVSAPMIEALAVAILARRSQLDLGRVCVDRLDPIL